MKKFLFYLSIMSALGMAILPFFYVPVFAQTPTALVFTVDFTGTSTERDRDAALLIIGAENTRREALEPPGTSLPTGTQAEIKSSTTIVLSQDVERSWNSYIEQAGAVSATNQEVKELWQNATDDQRAAAVIALGG